MKNYDIKGLISVFMALIMVVALVACESNSKSADNEYATNLVAEVESELETSSELVTEPSSNLAANANKNNSTTETKATETKAIEINVAEKVTEKVTQTTSAAVKPTSAPTEPAPKETEAPTEKPTEKPTEAPTVAPTKPVPTPTEPVKPTTPAPTEPTKPVHEHSWEAITKTVHHDEVSHTEKVQVGTVTVVDIPSYTYIDGVKVGEHYECVACGAWDPDDEHLIACQSGTTLVDTYEEKEVTVPAVTHEEPLYDTVKVIDKEAWDETVITGYQCSCGASK